MQGEARTRPQYTRYGSSSRQAHRRLLRRRSLRVVPVCLMVIAQPTPCRIPQEERARYAAILDGDWDIVWDHESVNKEITAGHQGHQVSRRWRTAETSVLTLTAQQGKVEYTTWPPVLSGYSASPHYQTSAPVSVQLCVVVAENF